MYFNFNTQKSEADSQIPLTLLINKKQELERQMTIADQQIAGLVQEIDMHRYTKSQLQTELYLIEMTLKTLAIAWDRPDILKVDTKNPHPFFNVENKPISFKSTGDNPATTGIGAAGQGTATYCIHCDATHPTAYCIVRDETILTGKTVTYSAAPDYSRHWDNALRTDWE